MKGRAVNAVILILSSICLVISFKLFWNMGIYSDEMNTSPERILGGELWLYMDWIRLALNVLIVALAGINLFSKKQVKKHRNWRL